MPTSASRASPGPLTTQPITATFTGRLRFEMACSTRFASEMRSMLVRPQVGQETSSGASGRRPQACRMRNAAGTSSAGSAVSETRMVSPMPSSSSAPMPTADLTMPEAGVPASVTPR